MKKIAVGLVAVFGLVFLQPVHAEEKPTVVIIDTAIDSTRAEFKNKIVYEACFVENGTCANGRSVSEGLGSATLPVSQAYSKGFEHGTIMTLIALSVNPNMNIIFIRVAGTSRSGNMGLFSDVAITNALNWVILNKTKFNIVSVSSSVGNHSLNSGINYCPIKPKHKTLVGNIDKLILLGVPTIFAAGNGRDLSRVDFPACIPNAVAVGGTTEENTISPFFNAGPTVDFYALGYFDNLVTSPKKVIGTSASAVAFSAYWAKNYKGTYKTTYDYLKSIAKASIEVNSGLTTNSFVDILK